MSNSNQKLVILDAGAQYGKVIDRRVRELLVESDILPLDTPATKLGEYQAIIISGGPESVYDSNAPQYDPEIFSLGVPILGVCYGLQLIVQEGGGVVEKKAIREDGQHEITIDTNSLLFSGLSPKERVLLTHGDTVDRVGEGQKVIAQSGELIAGVEDSEKKIYGVQFHPEVDLTENGQQIISNFLYKIAGFTGEFTMDDRMEMAVKYIQDTVGERQVLVMVSGGVDSTVTAALLAKALPSQQIFALHVDSGFMRQHESSEVAKALEKLGLNLRVVDAAKIFAEATLAGGGKDLLPLAQVTDPETKRNIIGDTFIKVAEDAIADLKLDPQNVMLAQGTLRPDLIESASSTVSSKAHKIKTHHNNSGLVRALRDKGRVVEPLQDYHKDEVRELGKQLGLSDELVWRQPFPGPGLAVRILCTQEPYLTADFEAISQQLNQMTDGSDFSAFLIPVRTVGVQGDGRTFSYLCGLSGPENWDELFSFAQKIPQHIHQINRVVYVFGEKMSGPITIVTPTTMTPEVIEQLRQADAIVNRSLLENGLLRSLSQVPVVLFPVGFGEVGKRSIGIRTFITNDFMTGVPARPGREIPVEVVQKMTQDIVQKVAGIARVVYDLTSKPPGTTEWE